MADDWRVFGKSNEELARAEEQAIAGTLRHSLDQDWREREARLRAELDDSRKEAVAERARADMNLADYKEAVAQVKLAARQRDEANDDWAHEHSARKKAEAERDEAIKEAKAEYERRMEMTRAGEAGELSGWKQRAEAAEAARDEAIKELERERTRGIDRDLYDAVVSERDDEYERAEAAEARASRLEKALDYVRRVTEADGWDWRSAKKVLGDTARAALRPEGDE
jgi:hypothetical protein